MGTVTTAWPWSTVATVTVVVPSRLSTLLSINAVNAGHLRHRGPVQLGRQLAHVFACGIHVGVRMVGHPHKMVVRVVPSVLPIHGVPSRQVAMPASAARMSTSAAT